MKNPWVIVGLVAVVLFGGAIVLANGAAKKSNEGVVVSDKVKGNTEAAVTLVEYSDFQCPACAAFQPVVKTLLDSYGDKIRFEYKHFPLPIHPFAQQAALAAEAAGQQGKFFEYHDALFENQKEWASAAVPTTFFIKYAEDLGLNIEQFKTQMKSSVLRDKVRADTAAARELQISGTPTFFLNGEKMEISTYEEFVTMVALAVDPNAFASSTASTTPPVGDPVTFGL